VEKMIDTKRTESLDDTANKPVDVVNCKNYVELKEPISTGFGNKSKSINCINDTYSHDVVDYYGP
jgi:hypothetical protein